MWSRAPRWPRRRIGWLVALMPPPLFVSPWRALGTRRAAYAVRGVLFVCLFFFLPCPCAPRAQRPLGFPAQGLPNQEKEVFCGLCHKRTPADRARKDLTGVAGGRDSPPLPSLPPPPQPLPPAPTATATIADGYVRRQLLFKSMAGTAVEVRATSQQRRSTDSLVDDASANDKCISFDIANGILSHCTMLTSTSQRKCRLLKSCRR